jgi:hypothetical protein
LTADIAAEEEVAEVEGASRSCRRSKYSSAYDTVNV